MTERTELEHVPQPVHHLYTPKSSHVHVLHNDNSKFTPLDSMAASARGSVGLQVALSSGRNSKVSAQSRSINSEREKWSLSQLKSRIPNETQTS